VGRLLNRINKIVDIIDVDKRLKGRILEDIIVCCRYEDGHIHTVYPSGIIETGVMIRHMAKEKGIKC